MKIGSKIRRKLSKKQRGKSNGHPVFEIVKFYIASGSEMVALWDLTKKSTSYMLKVGLDIYEEIHNG